MNICDLSDRELRLAINRSLEKALLLLKQENKLYDSLRREQDTESFAEISLKINEVHASAQAALKRMMLLQDELLRRLRRRVVQQLGRLNETDGLGLL